MCIHLSSLLLLLILAFFDIVSSILQHTLLLSFLGHVQQLSKTFYGKKNNRVPYFETLTAILKTILLEIEKSSPLTKHMPNKCGVVKNASRRSILARSSDGRASDC